MSVIKPQSGLNYPILSFLLALGIVALFMMGCATDPATGMSWRTEVHGVTHQAHVVESPQSPQEWQDWWNDKCVEDLREIRLPDSNYAWKFNTGVHDHAKGKHDSGQTMCVYSSQFQYCTCRAEKQMVLPEWQAPNWARVDYRTHVITMGW